MPTMMYNSLLLVGTGLLLAARDVASLNAPTCPACTPSPTPSGGVVCAQTVDGVRREFANICEMNRNNCINNKQAYTLVSTGSCAAATANVAKARAAGAGKAFGMPGSMQYGVQCGNCAGSATSAVCGRNSQARMVTFINICWMNLSNCYNPGMQWKLVNSGYCAGTTPAASTQKVNGVDGVANHPNIGMINSAECGKMPVSGKILNGQDAGLFQYPWMAYLDISQPATGKSFSCGGTVISPQYVLSAAHCVAGFSSPISVTAIVGDYKLSTTSDCAVRGGVNVCAAPAQWVKVTEALVHPLYDNSTEDGHDVSLLRLEKKLAFNTDSVKPICLPVGAKEEARVFNGEMMTIVGWGVTKSGAPGDTLQMATVPGVNARTCEQTYGGSTRILDGQLCAGGADYKDSCSGDSGGPIMYTSLTGNRMVEYGLVSYGVVCGSANVPGVYTRVGAYVKWILDNMKP